MQVIQFRRYRGTLFSVRLSGAVHQRQYLQAPNSALQAELASPAPDPDLANLNQIRSQKAIRVYGPQFSGGSTRVHELLSIRMVAPDSALGGRDVLDLYPEKGVHISSFGEPSGLAGVPAESGACDGANRSPFRHTSAIAGVEPVLGEQLARPSAAHPQDGRSVPSVTQLIGVCTLNGGLASSTFYASACDEYLKHLLRVT